MISCDARGYDAHLRIIPSTQISCNAHFGKIIGYSAKELIFSFSFSPHIFHISARHFAVLPKVKH
jgi:hypothetical protein